MRRKILIINAVTLFTLSSCGEDFLYRTPQGSVNQEALTNTGGVELLTVSAYAGSARSTGYDNMSNQVFGDVYGGDASRGSESNDQSVLNSAETYAVTATNDYLQDRWKDAYYGARRCNLALNVMKEAVDMDKTIKAHRTAELKFLRTLFMFRGVKIFGPTDTPYIDEAIAAEEGNPGVHSDTDVYPNILADIEVAIEGLPGKQTEVARPMKTTTKALRTKMLMQQGDITAAEPIPADVIADGLSPKGERLALQDDLDASFNATTENGKESTFEVRSSIGANNNGNYGLLLSYPRNTDPGGCYGFYQSSYELVNSFQVDENGFPYLGREYKNKKSVTERVANYGYISKNDKTIAVDPRLDFAVERIEIPYKDWGLPTNGRMRNISSDGVFLPRKHIYSKAEQDAGLAGSTYSSGWAPGSTMSLQYLRLRDCKLLYTECLVNDGELSTAVQQINDIRERAAKPDNVIYLEDGTPVTNYLVKPYPSSHAAFSNKETYIKTIHMERELELAMGGQRFFDLVRWGGDYINKELTTHISYGKQYPTKFYGVSVPAAPRAIFPLPETEIQTARSDENDQAYPIQNDAWK